MIVTLFVLIFAFVKRGQKVSLTLLQLIYYLRMTHGELNNLYVYTFKT